MALSVGSQFGRYEIVAALGGGGMGEVYRARDARLLREVAVKVLPAHMTDLPEARERFQREALAVAALQHPNICTVHDVGETSDGHAFLVMEMLQGETLQRRLEQKGAFDPASLLETGLALVDALGAAHAAGFVHRDVKPANIFMTARGPKILDFGLAKPLPRPLDQPSAWETTTIAQLTEPGQAVGTLAYMSPEQLRGENVDARSDLFSLGLVLYEMATGRRAFGGATMAVIAAAILHQEPTAPREVRPGLHERFEAVIRKALQKDRSQRYQRASDIASDLEILRRDSDPTRVPSRPVGPGTADALPAPKLRAAWRSGAWLAATAAAAVLALLAAGYFRSRRAPILTDKDTIVLADFANTTGDPVFDETLRRGLAIQLEQSPFLSLVSDDRMRSTLGLMKRAADSRLTPEIAREVCERTASAAVLEGSIAGLGTQYVLGLRAKNCRNGEVLAEEQAQAARKEDVLTVLSQIATRFRTRVGESLATVDKHSTPLEQAATSSLEALRAYSTGMKAFLWTDPVAGVALLRRAIEIDPQFAVAHAHLGLWYSVFAESLLSAESAARAYELRDRATDRERFFITAMYHRNLTGNLEEARQNLELWTATYPRDALAHGLLAGAASHGLGRFEQCLEHSRQSLALDATMTPPLFNLVSCNAYLGRLQDAEREFQAAARIVEGHQMTRLWGFLLAFLQGDAARMEREVALAKGRPGAEELLSHLQSLVLARAGRLKLARGLSQHAADLAQQVGQEEKAALYRAPQAIWDALFGNPGAARRGAMSTLDLSKGRDVTYASALALALAGDPSRPQALANDLERRFPEDTSVRFAYLPTLRGLNALREGDPAKAVEHLRVAEAHEVGVPAIDFIAYFGGLYSAYVRGLARLASGHGTEAAVEFRKLLDRRAIVLADPVGALAHLQLGRAYAMSGDATKAKAAYEDFLALWKDADAGLPILEQAKAEHARLR